MKLKSITIENIRSFRERTTIEFDKGFNILIGPNAGGKSNLLAVSYTHLTLPTNREV